MSNAYRDRPAVRVANGWRTFYVYNAEGVLVQTIGGFHEEGARRAAARLHGLYHEDLKAETKLRDVE